MDSVKRGYLEQNFLLFHLKDTLNINIDFHHHDFYKIVILLQGDITYHIEGKAYTLRPWDILLVSAHEVHKPVITSKNHYERIILWIDGSFLKSIDSCLLNAYKIASHDGLHLIRLPKNEDATSLHNLIIALDTEFKCEDFGHNILRESLFLQLIVNINRIYIAKKYLDPEEVFFDETIWQILKYINNNLEEDLTIDFLSSKFFMSKYYLMHKFKSETGYTLHSYVLEKKLSKSKELLLDGVSIYDICDILNFKDYSNFMRRFKKRFGCSPGQYKNHVLHCSPLEANNLKE